MGGDEPNRRQGKISFNTVERQLVSPINASENNVAATLYPSTVEQHTRRAGLNQ